MLGQREGKDPVVRSDEAVASRVDCQTATRGTHTRIHDNHEGRAAGELTVAVPRHRAAAMTSCGSMLCVMSTIWRSAQTESRTPFRAPHRNRACQNR